MEYMVVTSKHHEGFALVKSEYDDFNCVTGSPFGRDIIAELAETCYKHNLKFGLYYSQELDWHEPNGGGYLFELVKNPLNGRKEWDLSNYWDYPDPYKKNFTECFETKIKTQFKEILTKYSDLCLIWCDTPGVITNEQSMELYNMIKHYQPDCLINARIGNGVGDYHATGDNQVDFEAEGNTSAVVGNRTGLYECPGTTMDSWGLQGRLQMEDTGGSESRQGPAEFQRHQLFAQYRPRPSGPPAQVGSGYFAKNAGTII